MGGSAKTYHFFVTAWQYNWTYRFAPLAQVTIYLDDDVLSLLNAASEDSGVSKSRWIAEAIRLRASKEWPAPFLALAGSWNDFPTAEEIRKSFGTDVPREPF